MAGSHLNHGLHNGADPTIVRRTIATSTSMAILSSLVAFAVLIGWAFGIEPLKRVLGGTGVMKPWSAVSFGAAGLSLAAIHLAGRARGHASLLRRGSRLLALIPLSVGGATLLQYATGVSFGIDDLLFSRAVSETNLPWPGRMTPAAASGFLGLGTALLFLDLRIGRFLLSQVVVAIPGVAGLIGFLGYLYGVESLLRVTAYSSMAIHTSILFIALSLAVFLARPDVGLPAPLMSRFNGGSMARRVLPFAIALPLVIGWFRLWGEQARLYDGTFGLAIFAASNVGLFVLAIWVSAVRINRLDHARELAVQSLELSEARFRAINERSADLILATDRTGRVTFANPAAREVLGLDRAAGGRLVDVVGAEDRPALVAALESAASGDAAEPATFDLHVGDRVLEGAAHNRLATPHIEGILVSARDVTERRAAMRSLAESEKRLSTIFRDSPFPMVVVRRSDLCFVDANAAYLNLVGYALAELIGRSPHDVGILAAGATADPMVPTDSPISGVDLSLRRKDGSTVEVIASACVIALHGEPHVFSINFDVTEARRAQAERQALEAKYAEHSQQSQRLQAIGTLAGGIAHDFNNLLAVISGNLELLMHDGEGAALAPTGQPDRAESRPLEEIRRATDRAIDLTRRILAFSRRPEQLQHEQPTPAPAPRLAVMEAIGLLRATLPASIELVADIAEVPPVSLDHTSIQQIILNLGTNAAHAIGSAPGRIELQLATLEVDAGLARHVPNLAIGPCVTLSVRDSGSGIAPDVLPHVFEPFFTTKPTGRGTGLGLSVVHGLVHSAGGQIAIESSPGVGTLVRIYLPEVAAAAVMANTPAQERPPRTGCRVMYVDDEEALVWLTRRLLERRGYRVRAFTDPRQALDAFRADPSAVDIVVTDGAMPGLSGQQLAGALLSIRPNVPILLTTGYLTPEAIDDAKRCGVREVLLKPGTVEDLDRSIHHAVTAMLHT